MSAPQPDPTGRIEAGPALAETLRGLFRYAPRLPRLAWPALAVALLVGGLHRFVLPAEAGWPAAVGLVKLPFDLMLATAWARLLLRGPDSVRGPAVGWGRAETDFLFALVVFALSFVGCVVLAVLILGNLPLPPQTRTPMVAAASWLILTLLTPLALKLPARAVGGDLPGRAWQSRLANLANAAAVWLVFLGASFLLGLLPAQLPAGAGPVAALAGLVVTTAVDYVILLVLIGVVSAMFRQLAGWPEPAIP